MHVRIIESNQITNIVPPNNASIDIMAPKEKQKPQAPSAPLLELEAPKVAAAGVE